MGDLRQLCHVDMVERVGFLDVVSIASQRDATLVLPSASHAIALWPKYMACITPRFVHFTQTRRHLILRDTHTRLRLWIPGERLEGYLMSPYGKQALR